MLNKICDKCKKLAAEVEERDIKISLLQKKLYEKQERLDELETFEQGLGFVQKLVGIIVKQKKLN